MNNEEWINKKSWKNKEAWINIYPCHGYIIRSGYFAIHFIQKAFTFRIEMYNKVSDGIDEKEK